MKSSTRFAVAVAFLALLMASASALPAQLHDTSTPTNSPYKVQVQPGNYTMTVSEVDGLPSQPDLKKHGLEKGKQQTKKPESGQITLRWVPTQYELTSANNFVANKNHLLITIQAMNGGPHYIFKDAVFTRFSTGQMANNNNLHISTLQISYQDVNIQ